MFVRIRVECRFITMDLDKYSIYKIPNPGYYTTVEMLNL